MLDLSISGKNTSDVLEVSLWYIFSLFNLEEIEIYIIKIVKKSETEKDYRLYRK